MKTIVFVLTLFFVISVQAQDYRVLHIKNGTVSLNGVNLKVRDTLNGKSKVKFSNKNTFAVLVDKKNGFFTLKAPASQVGLVAKSITKENRSMSRAAEVLATANELNMHFNDDAYLVLDNKIGIHIKPDVAIVDKANFYFVRFEYKGQEINKKLYMLGDTLYLDKDSLYKIDNEQVHMPDSVKMHVAYYQVKSKKRTSIGDIQIIFPNNEDVLNAVKSVVEDFKTTSKSYTDFEGKIATYLSTVYGVPHRGNLEDWLKKYLNIIPSDFE